MRLSKFSILSDMYLVRNTLAKLLVLKMLNAETIGEIISFLNCAVPHYGANTQRSATDFLINLIYFDASV